MIDLTAYTVNKRIPKKSFGQPLNNISTITWLYKLHSDNSQDFKTSDNIFEIEIFKVEYKDQKVRVSDLKIIQKKIADKPILFLCSGKYYILFQNTMLKTNKELIVKNKLVVNKVNSNLTTFYESILKCFLNTSYTKEQHLDDAIKNDINISKKQKRIATLKAKITKEKQANKRLEMALLVNKIQKELNELIANIK